MIIGIGTDIVIIDRIRKIYINYGDIFAQRILCKSELEKFFSLKDEIKVRFLAKRYAAKEAISKAFGVGISKDLRFHDIVVSNNQKGMPVAKVTSLIGKNKKISISISDDPPIAVAFALIYQ